MSWLFTSGGQSIGASPSASTLSMSIQGWFPLGLTGLISLPSKEFSSLLQYHSSKASLLRCSVFFMVPPSHLYMTTRKTIVLIIQIFVSKVMSLLFNMLCRFVIAFLPRSKCLLISWLQSPLAVILEPPKNKVCHCLHFFPHLFAMKWWDWIQLSYFSECWVIGQLFHSPLSPSSRGSLVPLCFLPLGWCYLHIWSY